MEEELVDDGLIKICVHFVRHLLQDQEIFHFVCPICFLFHAFIWDIPVVLYRIVKYTHYTVNTTQLILLSCISYIVSFDDMFRL
jgi:uncharacterized membrane protein YesL